MLDWGAPLAWDLDAELALAQVLGELRASGAVWALELGEHPALEAGLARALESVWALVEYLVSGAAWAPALASALGEHLALVSELAQVLVWVLDARRALDAVWAPASGLALV